MGLEQLVTAGGTAGLIAFLLIVVYQFGKGYWQPRSAVEAAERRTVEADARTAKALDSGDKATGAVRDLTTELVAYRTIVQRLVEERGR